VVQVRPHRRYLRMRLERSKERCIGNLAQLRYTVQESALNTADPEMVRFGDDRYDIDRLAQYVVMPMVLARLMVTLERHRLASLRSFALSRSHRFGSSGSVWLACLRSRRYRSFASFVGS
jgi:hypothetical protein